MYSPSKLSSTPQGWRVSSNVSSAKNTSLVHGHLILALTSMELNLETKQNVLMVHVVITTLDVFPSTCDSNKTQQILKASAFC